MTMAENSIAVIPRDWACRALGEVTDLLTGFPFPSSGYAESGVVLVRGSNVKRGSFDWDDEITKYWPTVTSDISRYELREDDIVIAMDGALVGRSYAVIRKADLPCLLLQRVARVRSEIVSPKLLRFWIGSEFFVQHVDSVKTHAAIPHISPADIRSFNIAIPSTLAEQQAIAAALSDVDDLIGALEAAIAKKRAIKLAVMQQLLTGKTRLPGFDSQWRMVTLGQLADIQRGASPRPIELAIWYDSQSHIGWVRISDIANSDGRTLRWTRDYLSSKGVDASRFIPAGTLIMSICATVGRPVVTGFDTCIHDGFVSFCNLRHVDQGFLFYKLKELEAEFTAMGQTGSQANLNTDLVKGCATSLPSIEEQTAIATVLSDIDAEIAALERRRDKTRAIKQGMMQALLTGRVRFVES